MPETSCKTPPKEKFSFTTEGNKKVYTIRNGVTFTVPDRYTILARLGSGSYGTVCSAHDAVTGNKVAIKKCQTVFKYPEDGKRVLRELKLMKMMDHRNVLTINDVLVPNEAGFDDVYYVMDCMDTDLSHIIRSRTALSEQHCKYIIYQILRALKYIHSSNVLHRDLKPANILMNFDCRAKICDFGLARGFDPKAKGQQLTNYVVTRWYRAPELLLDNSTYSGAIDIWAAGCIFAEMLRGEALFAGESSNAQLKLICETLGVPPEDDLWWVHSTKHRQYIVQLGHDMRGKDFASLLPPGTSTLAVDFLKHMLAFNPYKRWNAEWLLDHPYLSDVHRPDSCTKSQNHFKWCWDSECPDATKLRQLFWEEIMTFHTDIPAGLAPPGLQPAENTAIPINDSKRRERDCSSASSSSSHRKSKALQATPDWRYAASQGGGTVQGPTKHVHTTSTTSGTMGRMAENAGASKAIAA